MVNIYLSFSLNFIENSGPQHNFFLFLISIWSIQLFFLTLFRNYRQIYCRIFAKLHIWFLPIVLVLLLNLRLGAISWSYFHPVYLGDRKPRGTDSWIHLELRSLSFTFPTPLIWNTIKGNLFRFWTNFDWFFVFRSYDFYLIFVIYL